MATRTGVLRTAAAHVGYTEKSNSVHRNGNVTKFWTQMEQKLGLAPGSLQGQPWCAAFVNSVLLDNGIDGLLIDGPALPFYTPSMERWAKDNGIWKDSIHLKPGDPLLFTEQKTIHTGFLERQIDANTVQTIEGNTSPGNSGSQANGGGVYRRRRKRSWVRGGIDLEALYKQSQEGIDPMFTQADLEKAATNGVLNATYGRGENARTVGEMISQTRTQVAVAAADASSARATAEEVAALVRKIAEKVGVTVEPKDGAA